MVTQDITIQRTSDSFLAESGRISKSSRGIFSLLVMSRHTIRNFELFYGGIRQSRMELASEEPISWEQNSLKYEVVFLRKPLKLTQFLLKTINTTAI